MGQIYLGGKNNGVGTRYVGSFSQNGTQHIHLKISSLRNKNVMLALKCMAN